MLNQIFLNEYFVDNVLDQQDLISLHKTKRFQFLIFLVQSSLSQEGQNVFHFDVLEQIAQTIPLEKMLSDEIEIATFNENVFNATRCLTCQILWLLFLLQN